MRLALLLLASALSALSALSQIAQTNFVAAAPNFREVDGQLYNIEKSKLWTYLHVKTVSVKTNGTLVMLGKPYYDLPSSAAFNIPSGYNYEQEIFIKHCPILIEDKEEIIRVKKVRDEMVNTIESGPLLFATWDYGSPHFVAVIKTNKTPLSAVDKIIEEGKRRAIEHYNSASEVAYRTELETKEHYNHLRVMNLIDTGASEEEIGIMKLRQEQELEGIKNRHEMHEIEWQRQEDKWAEEHSKVGN